MNNGPNINIAPYKSNTNNSVKVPFIDENNRRTLQASAGDYLNKISFSRIGTGNTFGFNKSMRPNSYMPDNIYRMSRNNNYNNYNIKSNVNLRDLFNGNINDNFNDENIEINNVTLNILSKIKEFKIEPYQTRISIRNYTDDNTNNNDNNNYNKYFNNLNVIKETYDNITNNNNINVTGKNPFIPNTNISVNINNENNNANSNANVHVNLRGQKPPYRIAEHCITLRDLFNGDVNDLVNIIDITKKSINYQTEEEVDENGNEEGEGIEGQEDEFNFLSDDEVKNLNEVTSAHNLNSSNNRNRRNDTNNNNNIYSNENNDNFNINSLDLEDLL